MALPMALRFFLTTVMMTIIFRISGTQAVSLLTRDSQGTRETQAQHGSDRNSNASDRKKQQETPAKVHRSNRIASLGIASPLLFVQSPLRFVQSSSKFVSSLFSWRFWVYDSIWNLIPKLFFPKISLKEKVKRKRNDNPASLSTMKRNTNILDIPDLDKCLVERVMSPPRRKCQKFQPTMNRITQALISSMTNATLLNYMERVAKIMEAAHIMERTRKVRGIRDNGWHGQTAWASQQSGWVSQQSGWASQQSGWQNEDSSPNSVIEKETWPPQTGHSQTGPSQVSKDKHSNQATSMSSILDTEATSILDTVLDAALHSAKTTETMWDDYCYSLSRNSISRRIHHDMHPNGMEEEEYYEPYTDSEYAINTDSEDVHFPSHGNRNSGSDSFSGNRSDSHSEGHSSSSHGNNNSENYNRSYNHNDYSNLSCNASRILETFVNLLHELGELSAFYDKLQEEIVEKVGEIGSEKMVEKVPSAREERVASSTTATAPTSDSEDAAASPETELVGSSAITTAATPEHIGFIQAATNLPTMEELSGASTTDDPLESTATDAAMLELAARKKESEIERKSKLRKLGRERMQMWLKSAEFLSSMRSVCKQWKETAGVYCGQNNEFANLANRTKKILDLLDAIENLVPWRTYRVRHQKVF